MSARDLDIVVYGATGFVGRQAARELVAHAPTNLRIGIAGRDARKLTQVAAALSREVTTIIADSTDAASVERMCAATRVVLATAGPFAKYGTVVVQSCVKARTRYVDITGETPWVREMIDRFHAQAVADGTIIVPFCGYDSVPSDIGTLLAVNALRARFGEATVSCEGFHMFKGGLNGGTLDSLLAFGDPAVRRIFADPFTLSPGDTPADDVRKASRDLRKVVYHAGAKRWVAPFVMGPINTRVVRRSALLAAQAGQSYGERFRYNEYWRAGSRTEAMVVLGVGATIDSLSRTALGRRVMQTFGPKPGEGPSERAMDMGFFKSELLAVGSGGSRVRVEMSGHGDPGNRATVRFLTEAAITLATSGDAPGGILTPARALGEAYVDRLRARGVIAVVK